LALGIKGVQIDTQLRAQLALVKLDYAQDALTRSRTEIGAYINRFSSTVKKVENDSSNESQAASTIEDVDYAQETATNTKNKIVQEVQIALQSQLNNSNSAYLKLLQ